jgi:hypothetical protein
MLNKLPGKRTYEGASATYLPPTTSSNYGGTITNTSFATPLSSTYGVSSNTLLPSKASFVPNQRIDYEARSSGKKYPGSVICQTPGGGLKIKLDNGGVKDVAPGDIYRVSVRGSTATSVTPAATSSTYTTAPIASLSQGQKKQVGAREESHGLDLLAMGNVVSERVVSKDELLSEGVLVEGETERLPM